MKPAVFALLMVLLVTGSIATSQESLDDLPKPLDPSVFASLTDAPPFRRVLSLSDSLVLTGVAQVPGSTIVTILNTATNESFVVGKEPNAQGWSLKDVTRSGNLRNVQATVDTGTQEITIRFDPRQLTPEIIRRERRQAAKPGRKQDGEPVQELMKRLDQELLSLFGTLSPTQQEEFRQSLSDYVDSYPDSTDELRSSFVRRKLRELRVEAEDEAESTRPANPSADPTETPVEPPPSAESPPSAGSTPPTPSPPE